MDLRLESMPFVFEGRTYQLRCNMNVLADVQEMNGGAISPALNGKRGQKSALQFLSAMMNDYADEQGWFDPDPETGAPILAHLGLVTRALTAARGTTDAKSGPEPADAGN